MGIKIGVRMIGFVLISTLSGCGDKADPKAALPTTGSWIGKLSPYVTESCAFEVDEGKSPIRPASSSRVVSSYFGKRYNRSWLAHVGHTSIRDTAAYIEKTDVRVYFSNPLSPHACKNLSFAQMLPEDLSAVWSQMEGTVGKSTFIGGLYLIEDARDSNPSLRKHAAIIVREDSSRWTLVHEFMHHNFKTQAIAGGYDNAWSQAEGQRLVLEMNTVNESRTMSDEEKIRELTSLFLKWARIMDRQMVEYTLEEVAIEAILQERYETGALTYVSPYSYANAGWYIQHSEKNADQIFASLDKRYFELRSAAQTLSLPDVSIALVQYEKSRDRRKSQLEALIQERKKKGAQARSRFFSLRGETKMPALVRGTPPCAQAAAFEKNVADMIGTIREIRLGL